MQSGVLDVSDAMFYRSRVLVNGVERECASWSVGRELSGDLPQQVSAVSGIVQATGTIVWVEANDVDDMPTTPFNESSGWLPRRGNRVEIYAGDGASEWKVFTGLVDSSSGDVGGSLQSRIIDDRDKLSAPFRHDPLLRVMPPLQRAAPAYRGVGLSYLYFVDAALRNAGFYATPPVEARQAVSVPMQSSMWPEVGMMTLGTPGGQSGGGQAWASTYNSVDGVAMGNVACTYAPNVRLAFGELYRVSATVDPNHNGNTFIVSYFDGSSNIQLAISASRTVTARCNGTTVCQIVMGSAVRVSLVIDGSNWELRTNTGASSTGVRTPPTTATLDRVVVTADPDSRVSGVHACYPSHSTRWLYTNFVPSARYLMDNLLLFGIMDAAPAVGEGTSYDLLDEISQATLSAMWIDEHGKFVWAPSPTLASSTPVRELTTADDVLSLPWEDNLLGTRSKVIVKHRIPAVSVSRWDNVLWHQGGAETLESGQVKTDFISPESGVDWVPPVREVLVLGDPGASAPSNGGWGSFTGAVLTDGETESVGAPYLTVELEQVNAQTFKLTHSVGALPSGQKLELRYPTESTTIWKRWLKEAFPLIRGFAKTQWADVETVGAPAGPGWAPVLEHDLGCWLARQEASDSIVVQRLADWLAAQTGTSQPTVGGMNIVPDPRLQLGDRITVRSDRYVGAVFTAIITGIELDAGDSFSQSVSVRLTSLETTFQSYDAWNTQYPGVLTYDQWAVLTAQAYDQFAYSKD